MRNRWIALRDRLRDNYWFIPIVLGALALPFVRSRRLRVLLAIPVIFVPIVLAYTSWTYWVFRHRLGVENIPDEVVAAA